MTSESDQSLLLLQLRENKTLETLVKNEIRKIVVNGNPRRAWDLSIRRKSLKCTMSDTEIRVRCSSCVMDVHCRSLMLEPWTRTVGTSL